MPTVYRHPRIHTGVPGKPAAQAVAVDHGLVTAVGDEASVRRAAGPAVDLVDLPGEAVVPGLYDAHIHTAGLALARASVDLREETSLADVLARVERFAGRLPPGAWLLGGWWNVNRWGSPDDPDRRSLDRVCPDRPVALASVDSHTVWANSVALHRSGITAATPDPQGGQIVRDADGEPTGILRESAARPVREAAGRAQTDLRDGLLAVQDELLSFGLTSIHDIDGEDARAAYQEMHAAGELGIRVHKAIPASDLSLAIELGWHTGAGDDWLSTGPVKLFADGALGSRTAHLSEPYAGEPDNTGIEVTSHADLVRLTAAANGAGICVATHAIGDEANRLVLDAYQQVRAERPDLLCRNRIEHAQHVQLADLARVARLGVVASMQPEHCLSDLDLVDRLLPGRALASYAWRSMLDHGVPLAFGSDAPVEPASPFLALAAAVGRTRRDGTPYGGWQPRERVSPAEALRAHTWGSAYAAGQESGKGVLAAGYLADLVALDRDPLAVGPEQLRETQVLVTVVGGVVRWQA